MKEKIDCPFCDYGVATLKSGLIKDLVFRTFTIDLDQWYYKCNKCEKDFTTTECDSATFELAEEKYQKIINNINPA